MIRGVGTDIVKIARIDGAIRRPGFVGRVLTAAELEHAGGAPSAEFVAGRWAAKEAFSKALGCGISGDCSFQDIEIIDDESGAPHLNCCGNAARRMLKIGAEAIFVSISHEREFAVATVILEGK
ncbi:MAG: holo-ACP synthase [Victivallaceae bacterium]|nr:holo-ACP synthase [Victivallaceae bacterium]